MRTLMKTIIVTLATVTPALAASGSEVNGTSILLILFLGFAALIIVFQFIPGLVLFVSMLKGLFTQSQKKAAVTVSRKQGDK
jgi:hypothetical protein